jgi:peptide/nickel transport system substrate-binding protein
MVDALSNGEVDLIYPQPQTDLVAQVAELPGVTSTIEFGATWEHFTYNFRNELIADDTVRQAINLGVDRQDLVDKLMKPFSDKAQVLDNRIYMNGTDGYESNAGNFATANVEEANKLLEDAGWVKGSDGIRAKDGKKLSFRVMTTPDNPLRERTEELFKNQMKAIGVDIRINNPPDPFTIIFGGEETAAQWDIALFAWVGTTTPAISSAPVYGTDQGNNPGAYSNEEVDEKFDEAIAELDPQTRQDLLNEADTLMWGDTEVPDLPLYQKPSFIAYSDKFINVVDNTTSEGFTWNAQLWSLK